MKITDLKDMFAGTKQTKYPTKTTINMRENRSRSEKVTFVCSSYCRKSQGKIRISAYFSDNQTGV